VRIPVRKTDLHEVIGGKSRTEKTTFPRGWAGTRPREGRLFEREGGEAVGDFTVYGEVRW